MTALVSIIEAVRVGNPLHGYCSMAGKVARRSSRREVTLPSDSRISESNVPVSE